MCLVVHTCCTSCCPEHFSSFLLQRSFNKKKMIISNHLRWALSIWRRDKCAQSLRPGCEICPAFAHALRRILNYAEQEHQYLWYEPPHDVRRHVLDISRSFFFFLFLVYGCICFRRVIETPRDRKSVAFLEQNFVLAEKRVNEFCFLFFFFGFVKFHYAVELKLSFSSLLLQDDEGGWHYSHLYAPRLRVTYILDLWFINSIKCISCSGLFEDSNSWKCIATQPRASLLFSWSLLRCLRLFWQQLLPRVRKKRSDLFSPW